jgi:hypothetical protein
MGFSGGKGIHFSIIFGAITAGDPESSEALFEEVGKYNIDAFKTVRRALLFEIAKRAGVDLEKIGMDKKKINFRVTRMGSQVREFGTIRAPGKYKTYISTIPEEKPEPNDLPLVFPNEVEIWNIRDTEYNEIAIDAIRKEIEKANNSDEYTPIADENFKDIPITKFPCIDKLFKVGIRNGRYYAGVAVVLMCQKCGISKEKTGKHLQTLVRTFPGISQADAEIRIHNALEMYGKEYHFSCTEIKETFSEYNLCNFSECPIKEKIEVERKAQTEFNYERCLEELSRIKPKVELRDRIPQATYFVNSEVLSKYGNLQEMELFIESEIFKYFDIPAGVNHPMSKIFRKGYNDLIKNKRKTQTNKIKTVEKEKTGTFDISEEFNGMYQKSISSTGNLIIEPFYDLIAKYVSDKLHTIVFHGNIFCYGDGCYSVNPYAVKAEATRVLNGIMKNENSRDISKRLSDLMTYISNCNIVNEYPFNKHDNAFPVKNGIVVFDWDNDVHYLEENPDPVIWKFDYRLEVDYDSVTDSTYILHTIKQYLFDNQYQTLGVDETKGRYDHRVILQMVAQGILQAMGYGPYNSIYFFVGQPDSGKTTLIDFISYGIGDSCRCTIGLDEFTSGDRFVMARKEGKIFNLHDDLGYFRMGDSGRVKAMSGGYTHKVERKGKDAYDGHITTVDVFTSNYPAGFNRNIYIDKAFWERWYYIHCPNHFEQNGEFQKQTFTEENKSAFLNEVIKMIMEIKKAKRLVAQKEEWTEVRKKWMQASNVLYKFIDDNMAAGGKTSFMKEELFTALKSWCIDNKQGEDLLPQRSFDLADMVELCGGEGDARRRFYNKGPNPFHCFVLPYTWKINSKYRKYCPSEASTDQITVDSLC